MLRELPEIQLIGIVDYKVLDEIEKCTNLLTLSDNAWIAIAEFNKQRAERKTTKILINEASDYSGD